MYIIESPNSSKKWRAYFKDGSHTDFGQKGANDFTITNDEERKRLYLLRHRNNENWKDGKSAGALSRFILWNKPTIKASLQDYKMRFGDL
jgi:hypothetical protein